MTNGTAATPATIQLIGTGGTLGLNASNNVLRSNGSYHTQAVQNGSSNVLTINGSHSTEFVTNGSGNVLTVDNLGDSIVLYGVSNRQITINGNGINCVGLTLTC